MQEELQLQARSARLRPPPHKAAAAAAALNEASAAAAARDEVDASKNRSTAAVPPKKQRTGNSASECNLDTTASLPSASAAYNDDVSEASTSVKVKAEFWNTGYTVAPRFIDEDEVEIVRNAISGLDGRRILCDIRNTLRQQTVIEMTANRDVDPVGFRWILDRVIKFASDMHPAWSVSERLTVFKTVASAKGEQLHRDFQCYGGYKPRVGAGNVSLCATIWDNINSGAKRFYGVCEQSKM
ncbi:unnamed protein product [Phytophthora fragariaefolia]|uniref:Unnamed protein product n=1 Tax=Phytophthora fragariaefolia TaxID=1490495 RepID=A0A9W6XEZ1_9STRA|nr:unnamed protein product [Phytophthora fragariaefolia]